MAIILARSWDTAVEHEPSQQHRGLGWEGLAVSHAQRGIAYAAGLGYGRGEELLVWREGYLRLLGPRRRFG
jgi:hypothetical protein